MKKSILLIITSVLIINCFFLTGCEKSKEDQSDKLNIVTTIFPPYDYARQITGEKANVTMLVPPGSESHSFEPTLSDLSVIYNSDIFIYGGGDSEEWVKEIAENTKEKGILTLKMADYVELIYKNEHDFNSKHAHSDNEFDEHVWTSPKNAMAICEKITEFICQKDEKNSELYYSNLNSYKTELEKLDLEFRTTIENANSKTLVFEGRSPFAYFCRDYDLDFYAAIDGCSSNTEVGLATVNNLINIINEYNIPATIYIELSNQKIADTICMSTGAKKLFLHSCHCVSKEEFENAITYIQLMKNNLNTIKEALG